jgi:ribonuclease III
MSEDSNNENAKPTPKSLFDKIGYVFKNTDLFARALTHRSFHNENSKSSEGHNERLEFLGDSVLDLSLSDDLMKRFSHMTEGELSKIRASLVNEVALSEVAIELGLDKDMKLGKGEQQSNGAAKPRLLASTLEALIGAIYQDSDFATADNVIKNIFAERIHKLDLETHFKSDYKTRLQEKVQSEKRQTPQYELLREEGPDHDKLFFVNLKINEQVIAQGSGRSKKQAEQDAARVALETALESEPISTEKT